MFLYYGSFVKKYNERVHEEKSRDQQNDFVKADWNMCNTLMEYRLIKLNMESDNNI